MHACMHTYIHAHTHTYIHGRTVLASLDPTSHKPDRNALMWNPKAIQELSLDKAKLIEETWKFFDGDDEPINWCL